MVGELHHLLAEIRPLLLLVLWSSLSLQGILSHPSQNQAKRMIRALRLGKGRRRRFNLDATCLKQRQRYRLNLARFVCHRDVGSHCSA
jgi:hypothetical protein